MFTFSNGFQKIICHNLPRKQPFTLTFSHLQMLNIPRRLTLCIIELLLQPKWICLEIDQGKQTFLCGLHVATLHKSEDGWR
uniref:Uncharacterized protein n=1 Tax=Rhizophora mucronata TaxID=61149 RepID=A0A2P2QS85_RHIMU